MRKISLVICLIILSFLMILPSCEQPGTPSEPDSPSTPVTPDGTPDTPDNPEEPAPEPEPVPEPEPMSIWDIQSFDDLFKFATGAYNADPENLPNLEEGDMSVALQAAGGILLADGSEFDSGDKESITLQFFGNDGVYGKMLVYAGADSLQICNGVITYGGDVLRMVDCAIAFGDSGPYVVSGSILVNDAESDFNTASGILDEASAEAFDQYSLTNMEQGNVTYSLLQTAHVVGEDTDMSDTVYYTAEVDGKTVTVSVNPFLVYPVDDRRIEYIAIDGVLYNAAGVAEFIYSDIQSVSIYNVKYDEVYETGNDAVITMEPENAFSFYPVTYPDTDASYNSGFSWSLTDSEGNPTDAATLKLDEETGLLTLTAVYGGNYTLTLTSNAKPELSCSVAIVINGSQKSPNRNVYQSKPLRALSVGGANII